LHSSVLRFAHRLFLWLGVAALAYAGGTAAYAVVYQRYQSWQFERARVPAIVRDLKRELVSATARNLKRERVSAIARNLKEETAAPTVIKAAIVEEPAGLREGDVIGKLEVPRIGISVIVLQGIENHTLIVGAGHIPGTPLPGADGNVAIAAHRDTFFRKLEGIIAGDRIDFATVRRTYEYVVDSTEIVDPEDTQAMESRARPELTLITCYPFYFVGAAPKRFIVHAQPSIEERLRMWPTRE
jgi:LPXTG-site transpeptidase (sortase) family protein